MPLREHEPQPIKDQQQIRLLKHKRCNHGAEIESHAHHATVS